MSTPNPQPPLKRGSGATDTEPVTRPELAYMLDGLQASLRESNKSAVEACVSAFGETQTADFNKSIETAITKYDGMQQARFREMDSEIERVQEKVE